MNIASYSLYGSSKLYCLGALENIPLVHKYYPGWVPRFYVAENCPALPALQREEQSGACQIEVMPPSDFHWGSTCGKDHQHPSHLNMTYRYRAIFDKGVSRCLFRDCDSRPSERESDAVQQWIESGKIVHAIYERQVHHDNGGVMAGMSGVYAKKLPDISLDEYLNHEEKFRQYYATEGYKQGVRFVHYDLWLFRKFFFEPYLKINEVFMSGHGTPNPLRVPVDPLYGEVGSTVNESWRYEEYK